MAADLPARIGEHWQRDVVVTGPTGATWTGKLVGYLGQPSIALQQPDGSWVHLAASFKITAPPEHEPRLVAGTRAYCAVCEHGLRRGRDGVWRAVWSGSRACTGAPVEVGP